jgi:hypothetical protein
MSSNKNTIQEEKMNNTETTTLDLAEELGIEDISQVSGGTAFTAGTYNFNYHISHPTCCMNCLKEGYFTGNEREDYFFFGLFSHHQLEYRCDACNQVWWVYGHLK